MIIFKVLSNLYTNTDSKWILDVDESTIKPVVIQRWLSMNDNVRNATRWLDKFAFTVSPKMYLSLAWSVIPKVPRTPYIKYIKKEEEEKDEYSIIISKIQKMYHISDNDIKATKKFIKDIIDNNRKEMFDYFKLPKSYYIKYHLELRK